MNITRRAALRNLAALSALASLGGGVPTAQAIYYDPQVDEKLTTAAEIQSIFKFCRWVRTVDERYVFAPRSWVLKTMVPNFRQLLQDYGMHQWKREWDCDKYASAFRMVVNLCHGTASDGVDGIGVGEFGYTKDSGEGHCINVILAPDRDGLLWFWFFEPQTCSEVVLSRAEILSATMVRF